MKSKKGGKGLPKRTGTNAEKKKRAYLRSFERTTRMRIRKKKIKRVPKHRCHICNHPTKNGSKRCSRAVRGLCRKV